MDVVLSTNPDTDTLRCPKCKAIWRAKGDWHCGEDRWSYDELDAEFCPRGCINFFGFRVTGKLVR